MAEDPETYTVTSFGVDAEYRFASGVEASKPGSMVYLDFVQSGAHIDRAQGIARIVMRPELAADLIEQLSALRDDA
jgi:hypothetical protein